MPKIVAIAIRQSALTAAVVSLKNCIQLAHDFMYGTPERTNATLWFAFGLAVLGCAMSYAQITLPQFCPA